MDLTKLSSEPFQRVYHYLKQFSESKKSLDIHVYNPENVVKAPVMFLRIVLRYVYYNYKDVLGELYISTTIAI